MSLSRTKSQSEAMLHKGLTAADRDDLLRLQTLQELPKARYATKTAMTALPAGRARKVVYSHVEVYKMVETVATAMRESGVRPGVVCAMILGNSVEAVVYFLASAWIGAIAAPIPTDLSLEDTVHALRCVRAATVVSPLVDEDEQEDDPLYQKVHAACEQLGLIEWHISRTTNEGVVLEMHGVRAAEGAAWKGGAGDFTPDSSQVAAYHASVSGETSLVVPLTHGNFAAAVLMFVDTYKISADNTTILTRPWFTIDGLLTILSTVYSGGHIIVPGKLQSPDEEFLKTCGDCKVDWFTGDPDFLASLCDVEKEDPDALKDANFNFIRSVAGNLDEGAHEAMEKILDAPVLEAYGTPETCGIISCNVISAEKGGTKGAPAAGVSVKIFDEGTRTEDEEGKEGLVGVAGCNVATGYLDNDEANEAVLLTAINNKNGKEETFFLTGDKGVFDGEGYLKVWERTATGRAEAFAKEVNERIAREREQKKKEAEEERKEIEEREAREKEAEEARLKAEEEEKAALEAKLKAEQEERAEINRRKAAEEAAAAAAAAEAAEAAEAALAAEAAEAAEAAVAAVAEEVARNLEEERQAEEARKLQEERERAEKWSTEDDSSSASFHSAVKSESERYSIDVRSRGFLSGASSWIRQQESDSTSDTTPLTQTQSVVNQSSTGSATTSSTSKSEAETSPRDVVSATRVQRVVEYVQQPPVYIHDVDPNALEEIIARLGTIEENQRKLEVDMREAHQAEMDEMRRMLAETRAAYDAHPPSRVVPVNLDDVNSAISRATHSAQTSRENTERAVAAANAATAAAEAAAAKFEPQPLSMVSGPQTTVEVRDPDKVHKTVLVSLDDVETAILMHPSVARARAFGRPDKRSGMEVYCVIQPKIGARVSEPWLKLHAQSVLPAACVPKKFFAKTSLAADAPRSELAIDKKLLRISALSGYTPTKVIKGPAWTPGKLNG